MTKFLHYFIGLVWVINGLFCKVLNLVPRHEAIVGRVLGSDYAHALTLAIGVSEILMCVWILSRIKPKLCAIFQMIVVAVMNIIEFVMAPDLLLFGKGNILYAILFIAIIYYQAFIATTRKTALS